MRRSILFIGLIAIFITAGCNGTGGVVDEEISPRSVMENLMGSPEDVGYRASGDELLVYVINDTLAVSHNTYATDRGYITCQNLLSGQGDILFEYGSDDDKILSATCHVSSGSLFLYDYVKSVVHSVDLERDAPQYKSTPVAFSSQQIIPYGSSLAYINPGCFYDPDGRLSMNAPRVLVDGRPERKHKKPKYEGFNATFGWIDANVPLRRFVFVDKHRDYMEIIGEDGNVLKRITGPDHLKQEYALYDNGYSVEIIRHVSANSEAYTALCSDDGRIYCAYLGRVTPRNDDPDYKATLLLEFNWDGELLHAFNTGTLIKTLSLSSEPNVLYAWEELADGTCRLNKYHIHNN